METSGLAQFLLDEYYENWKSNRRVMFEGKWNQNLEAFEGITTNFWKKEEAVDWRSDTFIGVTKQKILAAWAIVVDMFLQENKFPFRLVPSPMDNIYLEDLPREDRAEIIEDIEDMSRVIRQQMKDTKANTELMKCVMAGALYGETYAKRFTNTIEKPYFIETDYGRWARTIQIKQQPGWEYVSGWQICRDYEVEDLKECAGICQSDYVSAFMLRQSIGAPGFIKSAIEDVISENQSRGRAEATEGGNNLDYNTDWATLPNSEGKRMTRYTSTIPRKEFWARVPLEVAEEFESDIDQIFYSDSSYENDGNEVEVMALVADETIVRYARVTRDDRPFYWTPWEIKLDFPGGAGVADNVQSSQKVLNGMVRAFEDNKKLSANVILAAKEQFFQKMGDSITPGMKIKLSEEVERASDAVHQVIIQDVGETLLSGIGLFERYADEESQLPKILQGAVHEKQKADTAFELNQLQANAGKYIGGVIKNYDENLIEPIVYDFYEYNMLDPDVPVAKRNLTVEAIGYRSFQDKIIRLQRLIQLFNLLVGNEVTLADTNVRDLIREISIALSVDPSLSLKRREEKDAELAAQQEEIERRQAIEEKRMTKEGEKVESETEYNQARSEKERAEADQRRSEIRVKEAEAALDITERKKGLNKAERPKERKLEAVKETQDAVAT